MAALLALAFLAGARKADAHPLGNFSISHYTGIEVRSDSIVLHYVIDMAEIPTFLELQENGIASEEDFLRSPYGGKRVESLKKGLVLEVNGARCALETGRNRISFPPGVGGMITMRIESDFNAPLKPIRLASRNDVRYADGNFEGRVGWKEIVVYAADSAILDESSVGSVDRSSGLSAYPQDGMSSPPQDLSARFTFAVASRPGSGKGSRGPGAVLAPENSGASVPGRPQSRGASRWDVRFMQLISEKEMSRGVFLFSMFLAMLLGAFHALEPGHGKTLVAAYLVGSRGTPGQALLLGLVVTLTHTAGVFLLGASTMFLSKYVLPERFYPWMGFASGIMIAAIGFAMFLRRVRKISAGDARSGRHHPHAHPGDGASEGSLRQLLGMGISGGIVPCPSALVVLLGAISLGRAGYGMLLIVSFSMGLAMVLVAIGLLVVQAGRIMIRFREDSPTFVRWLPLISSAFIMILGVVMATQGFVRTGIVHP